jgi:hypothetical protein
MLIRPQSIIAFCKRFKTKPPNSQLNILIPCLETPTYAAAPLKSKFLSVQRVRWALCSLRSRLLSLDLKSQGLFLVPAEEHDAASKISIVVAVHNAPEVTLRCLSSLERFAKGAEVIIVDDGSDHQVIGEILKEICMTNHWTLISHEKPLGHSRASEVGISASGRKYVCLLNSDTVVTPRSWGAMVKAFESDLATAVVGPATSFTYGPQQVLRAYRCRHFWTDEQIWSFAENYTSRYQNVQDKQVNFAGGFAFFIRRTVWDELDGFDLMLPDYGNEAEFCQRVLEKGLRIVTSKGSYIHHLGRQSYGQTFGRSAILRRSLEAQTYIEKKYGSKFHQ